MLPVFSVLQLESEPTVLLLVILLMLQCSPLPNITWSRLVQGDNSLLGSNIDISPETFLLSIRSVQQADVGEYVCSGSHGVGQLLAHLKLRGNARPAYQLYIACIM